MDSENKVRGGSNLPEQARRPRKSESRTPHRQERHDRRAEILHAIENYRHEHGRPPTFREICSLVGVNSTSHVYHHVRELERQGLISREPHRSRGLLPTRPEGLPILGTIAAGEPLEQFDSGEAELLELDELTTAMNSVPGGTGREVYALRVHGTSMIEDGILDGDYVIIAPGSTAVNGAIAVAIQNTANGGRGAATIKRFFKRPDCVQLQPANAALAARIVPAEEWDRDWKVQGTVVAIYRQCIPTRIAAL
jgi:repressor LexA